VTRDPDRVIILDTTLRDGEQSPGASLNATEKLHVARQLARLGVDVIEAGFPAASPDDRRSVARVAEVVGQGDAPPGLDRPPTICALARAVPGDIDSAWDAVRPAAFPRIHTFIATSDIHMRHKLDLSRDDTLVRIREMVARARSLCEDVEFSAEDASRSDRGFLKEVVSVAIASGATTINIPDTVGYATPREFETLLHDLLTDVPGADGVVFSVHCHDDLGLATANTLAALRAGVRQVEVTVNGIGERAGNAALEEVVMMLSVRSDELALWTGVQTAQIMRTSRMVSRTTGLPVQPNKAIVGANAFAHEAGIHQDGILKHEATYEIMRPETVGLTRSTLVLGKHSGRHAFRVELAEIGYELTDEELEVAFREFKRLAEKLRSVTHADLEALIADLFVRPTNGFRLLDLQVVAGRSGMPTATVKLAVPDGGERIQAAVGAGPVDAMYSAIAEIVKRPNTLLEYAVHAITEGIDAQGTVHVQLADDRNRIVGGYGSDPDILVASAKAYVSALNRLGVLADGPLSGKNRPKRDRKTTQTKEDDMDETKRTSSPKPGPAEDTPGPAVRRQGSESEGVQDLYGVDEGRAWALQWDAAALFEAPKRLPHGRAMT